MSPKFQMAMNIAGMRQSDNIEDRRGEDEGDVVNRIIKADRESGPFAPPPPVPRRKPRKYDRSTLDSMPPRRIDNRRPNPKRQPE